MTKFAIDLPSAAIGAGVSATVILALTAPLLQPLRLFDYSGTSPLWAVSGIAVLAAAGCFMHLGLAKPQDTVSPQRRNLAERFPASVRQDGGDPSLKPVDWVRRERSKSRWMDGSSVEQVERVIGNAFSVQVLHSVDDGLEKALRIAFNGFAQSRKDSYRFLRELAVRMMAAKAEEKVFDYAGYETACLQMGYRPDMARQRGSFSPFQTVDLVDLLRHAREESGVLASADFLWLKSRDRTLWYALNNLGRREFHIEAAGIMAHYGNQLQAKERLTQPKVEEAVNGVMDYFVHHGLDIVADTEPKR